MSVAAAALTKENLAQQLAGLRQEMSEDQTPGPEVLVVVNKTDLAQTAELQEQANNVSVSARTGEGLDLLKSKLQQLVGFADEATEFSARARHVDALLAAASQVDASLAALQDSLGVELVAEELSLAQQHLGGITGDVSADDLLGRIFSEFCIGK